MVKIIPSLKNCLERHIKFGECECYYKKWITPYKCNLDILTCKVCGKHYGKRYHEYYHMTNEKKELGVNIDCTL